MTQTVTVVTSSAVTPTLPGGSVTRTTDDAILVGVWSTAITVDTTSTFVATPGSGGSLIVQLSDDAGLTWRNVRDSPFTSLLASGVSPGATRIRASAIGSTGTLVVDTPIPEELAVGGGTISAYTAAQLAAKADAGTLTPYATYVASDTLVNYRAMSASELTPTLASEATAYVTLTATGTAFTGICEFAGYYCSVAAGNITVYDATSAAGTPIIPTTALATGPFPIFGAGTNGKLILGTGCHVVLSGAATVRMLVQ